MNRLLILLVTLGFVTASSFSRAEGTNGVPDKLPPNYAVWFSIGDVSSTQNADGAMSNSALGLGLGGNYKFTDEWGAGLDIVTSKPLDTIRTSSYLVSLDYHVSNFTVSGMLGMQSLIDDRAAIAYIDPFTGRVVKQSDEGFTYGAKASYDFVIPTHLAGDFALAPSVRYLHVVNASFHNQFYFMLELKFLGHTN